MYIGQDKIVYPEICSFVHFIQNDSKSSKTSDQVLQWSVLLRNLLSASNFLSPTARCTNSTTIFKERQKQGNFFVDVQSRQKMPYSAFMLWQYRGLQDKDSHIQWILQEEAANLSQTLVTFYIFDSLTFGNIKHFCAFLVLFQARALCVGFFQHRVGSDRVLKKKSYNGMVQVE